MNESEKLELPVILGIDPGTNIMGYGLIRACTARKAELLALGVVDLHRISDPYRKMKMIFDRTISLIDEFHPTALAIEAPFFGKNVQSMLKLGRAQGTAIAAALSRSLEIYEYAPRKIKMAITGQGAASKEQVASLLKSMFNFGHLPDYLDATDGLAAAVCHFYQTQQPAALASAASGTARKAKSFGSADGAGHKSWKAFAAANPKRVK